MLTQLFISRPGRPPLGGHVVGRVPAVRAAAHARRHPLLLLPQGPGAREGEDQTRGEGRRRRRILQRQDPTETKH